MGDSPGSLLVVGQALLPLVGIGVIVQVLFRLTDLVAGQRAPGDDAAGQDSSGTEPQLRAARITGSWIAHAGLALPWLVGLAVKFVLDAAGEPTYPVASFLDPAAVLILLAATALHWCSPLLLLAAWTRSRFFLRLAPAMAFPARILVVRLTALGGLVAEALLFVRVFREWDTMYVFVPIGFFLLPGMGLGWGIGMLLVRRRSREVGT